MSTAVLERPVEVAEAADERKCDVHGCCRAAEAAIVYRTTEEWHTHECSMHLAESREWFDVLSVTPMPCTLSHANTRSMNPPDLT